MKRHIDLNAIKRIYDCYDFIPVNHARRVRQNKDGTFEVTGGCGLCDECAGKRDIITVKPGGQKFFCRRYQKGGGVIESLALANGIISCNELGKRQFTKEEWGQIFQVIESLEG